MQNPETGRMEMINQEIYDKLKKGEVEGVVHGNGTAVRKGVALFRVNQIVEVNGGRFRVRKITKNDIILRGISG